MRSCLHACVRAHGTGIHQPKHSLHPSQYSHTQATLQDTPATHLACLLATRAGWLGSVHHPACIPAVGLTQWSAHYRPVELAKLPRIIVDEAAPAPVRAGLLRNEWLISAMAIIGVCAHRCARARAHIAHVCTHSSLKSLLPTTRTHAHDLVT